FFIVAGLRYQLEAPANPQNVDVHRKNRTPARKQERTRDRLWTDAFEAAKKRDRLFEIAGAQERKIERSPPPMHFAKELPDPLRFLTRESSASNGRFD